MVVDLCPEAHGVDLDSSMPKIGIEFTWFKEWPPKHSLDHILRYIALGGYPRNKNSLIKKGLLGRTD